MEALNLEVRTVGFGMIRGPNGLFEAVFRIY